MNFIHDALRLYFPTFPATWTSARTAQGFVATRRVVAHRPEETVCVRSRSGFVTEEGGSGWLRGTRDLWWGRESRCGAVGTELQSERSPSVL